jgi:hypothetical protein
MRGDVDVHRSDTAKENPSRLVGRLQTLPATQRRGDFRGWTIAGRTPLRLDLPARSHELVAHLDGWPDEQQRLTSSRNETTQLHLCSQMAA